MTLWVATYETEQGSMVAVADDAVAGETYVDGEVTLDVDEAFYCDEERDEGDVEQLLGEAAIANLAGDRAVELGVECGAIDAANVLEIDGVPHAQMVRI